MRTDPMLTESDWPRAHLVMDDFFEPSALRTIFEEVRSVERRMKPGLVRDVGHDGQSVFFEHARRRNKALWIHDPSKTLTLFRERLWSAPLVDSLAQAREPLFQIIPNCWAPHLQVSTYMTGDHYDFHEDEGAGVNLTAIVFLAREPKKVRGGDLTLAYDGEEATIRFRHNRLVIFPSKTLHRVTPVRIASEDPRDARISLQCWLTYGRPSEEGKPKRRPPAADQATFLLAEEAIVEAAQSLSDTGARARAGRAPEDLYWGAFYLSRILSSNLRVLIAMQDGLTVGGLRIGRAEGGELEVYGRGRLRGTPIRVGFRLLGSDTPSTEAVQLFVETGRGAVRRAERGVPSGTDERKAATILRRLLARV